MLKQRRRVTILELVGGPGKWHARRGGPGKRQSLEFTVHRMRMHFIPNKFKCCQSCIDYAKALSTKGRILPEFLDQLLKRRGDHRLRSLVLLKRSERCRHHLFTDSLVFTPSPNIGT